VVAVTVTKRGRRLLRLGLALVAVLALASTGWLWLRDSSFVQVRDVEVTGVTTSNGDQVRAALEAAALDMTTLHVRADVLRDATASYPSVADVRVTTDFPHAMTIRVLERQPVAAVAGEQGEQRIPVTAGGLLLHGVNAERDLPSLVVKDTAIGERLTDKPALRALAVAGAAPDPLLRRSEELAVGNRGVVVQLQNGPELVFGSPDEAGAKWTAAARVLAETSAAGATYLDLRSPGRVAAGGLAPVQSSDQNTNPQPEAENSPNLNP
jgi:cell division protein FtsQ